MKSQNPITETSKKQDLVEIKSGPDNFHDQNMNVSEQNDAMSNRSELSQNIDNSGQHTGKYYFH